MFITSPKWMVTYHDNLQTRKCDWHTVQDILVPQTLFRYITLSGKKCYFNVEGELQVDFTEKKSFQCRFSTGIHLMGNLHIHSMIFF